jgi:D-glycero-alpha-D-manno-heptose-7-phosphate kinase
LDRASQRVRARAWCRVDLAGGTLDIWPLGLLHAGARTVNLAVDLPVEVELTLPEDPPGDTKAAFVVSQGEDRREAASAAGLIEHPATSLVGRVAEALDLPPFEARLSSASPRGGGLGASSAMVVGLIAAAEELFDRPRSSHDRLAVLGRDLEARMMALPTGVQDHHAALLGGLLDIRYTLGGDTVHRLPLDEEALGASLVLAFTGQSHFSAGQNWQIIRRRMEGEAEVTGLLQGIADTASELVAALEAGDLAAAGALVGREWSHRRRLADGVSTPGIEDLLERARGAGAWGGKACGAGGGGCIVVLTPPERRAAVEAALEDGGATLLAARPVSGGLTVERGRAERAGGAGEG